MPWKRSAIHLISAAIQVAIVLNCLGCSQSRNPVQLDRMSEAKFTALPGVRAWGGAVDPDFQKDLVESMHQQPEPGPPVRPDGSRGYSALALSGGGANGAFGAGFLCGWSDAGTRPQFKIVTGISTGALIAPAAFLGSDYDNQLREVYTQTSSKQIYKPRNPVSLLWSESFTDSAPLYELIERHVDRRILDGVAAEYRKGRRLYIGTTHLDAGRFVIWNMGKIADSGHPDSLEIFRKVMLASASIPAVFPPVYFNVEVGGNEFDEMHVDGGTITQVFFYGFTLDLAAARRQTQRAYDPNTPARLYIIRNSKLAPTPEQVQRKLPSIIKRSLNTLTRMNSYGDLYRIYLVTQRDNIGFYYADIPADYISRATEAFDIVEMNRLFRFGYETGRSDYDWHRMPPGFDPQTAEMIVRPGQTDLSHEAEEPIQ